MYTVVEGIEQDIDSWMELVRSVRWNFPGLETEDALQEHKNTVLKFMRQKTAICVKDGNRIIGVLLFSINHNMICCLAVSPDDRNQGIGSKLLAYALERLDRTQSVTVSTFREEDEKGVAPRALYQKFGFVPDELIEEFGYPNQRFVLYPDCKVIDIVGDNYFGKWNKTRIACRGIVIRGNEILLSYETLTNQWMLPGGGLEAGEAEKECCIREVAEETGVLVKTSQCLLEINEYYEDWKWVNRYFICEVVGSSMIKLTEREKKVGMEPRWLPISETKSIFSEYNSYADTDENRRGMYLREYTALCELVK